jgi:hypothetical protein
MRVRGLEYCKLSLLGGFLHQHQSYAEHDTLSDPTFRDRHVQWAAGRLRGPTKLGGAQSQSPENYCLATLPMLPAFDAKSLPFTAVGQEIQWTSNTNALVKWKSGAWCVRAAPCGVRSKGNVVHEAECVSF